LAPATAAFSETFSCLACLKIQVSPAVQSGCLEFRFIDARQNVKNRFDNIESRKLKPGVADLAKGI
jgi:hypothetical protein